MALPRFTALVTASARHRLSMCICFSVKYWLSEVVHLTCYRICARALSATIHYHNKSVHFIASCQVLPVEHFLSI